MAPQQVPIAFEAVGQAEGSREVEIRARVSGILEKRVYDEGAPVKAGAVLFRIDRAPYEIALAQARAALGEAQARQEQAHREAARLKAILVERARQARLAEQRRLAKLKAEREAKIRAERAKAAAAARAGRTYTPRIPAPVQSDPTPSNYLSYPAHGRTTSGFGMRWHPVLQKWMLHDGLDWGIACGTPVRAAAPGTVIRAGWRESGWGNQVLIDHGIHRGVDLVTSYNHLSSIVVWGGTVERGQLIGYSGTTGYSTGCHLHFTVLLNGNPTDPMKYM